MQSRASRPGLWQCHTIHRGMDVTPTGITVLCVPTAGDPCGVLAEPASCVIFTPNSWHHCNYGKMLDKHQLKAILQITDQGSQVMSGAGEAGVSVCAGHQSKSPFTGRLQHMNLGAGRAGRKRGPLSNRVWARLHPGIAHWVLEHRKDSGGSADEDGSLRSWGQGHSDIIHCTSLKKNLEE